jgi:dTMP kinase
MLIVLEGSDGGGKGTQIQLLKARFPEAVLFKYPTRNYQMLNDYLQKKIFIDSKSLFLLFLADIADEQEKMKKALSENKLVILDRYVFSTIAYEVDGFSHESGKKIVEGVGFVKPDQVILLDVPPEVSQERKRKQKELDRYEEDLAYLGRVRSNFRKLCEERFLTPNWHMIDAMRSVDEIHADIVKLLR